MTDVPVTYTTFNKYHDGNMNMNVLCICIYLQIVDPHNDSMKSLLGCNWVYIHIPVKHSAKRACPIMALHTQKHTQIRNPVYISSVMNDLIKTDLVTPQHG